MPDVFANTATLTTTSTSGTTNPSSGTSETWSVSALSSLWPLLLTGQTMSIQDAALPNEIIRITASGGAGDTSITVTRGADGTTPLEHNSGATYTCTAVASALNGFTASSATAPTNLAMFFNRSAGSAGNSEIFYALNDGSAIRQITNNASYQSWWPKVSPDGSRILFLRTAVGNTNYDSSYENNQSLWVANVDGTNPTQIVASNWAGGSTSFLGTPNWHPNGRDIVFFGGSNVTKIYTVPADGSASPSNIAVTGITTGVADTSYSPDGQTIAFTYLYNVCTVPVAGGVYTTLTTGGTSSLAYYDPNFSFDNQTIAFLYEAVGTGMGHAEGEWGIQTVLSNGTNQTILLNDGNVNSKPCWGEDGYIYFHRLVYGDSAFSIAKIRADGSGSVIRLTAGTIRDGYPDLHLSKYPRVPTKHSFTHLPGGSDPSVPWYEVAAPTGTAATDFANINGPLEDYDWVMLQPGAYNIGSNHFTTFPATNTRLSSPGKGATTLTGTASAVFVPASNAFWWELDHVTIVNASGHIFHPTVNLSAFDIHHASLQCNDNAASIWAQSAGAIIEGYFRVCDLSAGGSSPSVAAFNLTDPGGAFNANVFEKCVCTWQNLSTEYFFSWVDTEGTELSFSNTFRDIVFEQCAGGEMFFQGHEQLTLENVQSWDTNQVVGATTADLIHIGKSSGGLSSRGISIKGYGRYNSTLGSGKYDISLDPTTQQYDIDGARSSPDNVQINLNNGGIGQISNQSPGTIIVNGTGSAGPVNGPNVVLATATHTTALGERTIATANTFTVTLPAPTANAECWVTNQGTGTVTVTPPSGSLFNGSGASGNIALAQSGGFHFVSNGTNWYAGA